MTWRHGDDQPEPRRSGVARLLKALGDALGEALTLLVALRDLFDGFIRALNALEQGRRTAPA
ncbi:hypothetical protein [Prauserella shujinwangii]|uniref:hypothetical protein n=1 Tax=Prauserella shujinwangii TaxID=1453103 RepID=UPI000D0638B4|nr:hypothetical protein [Prauserella shujinwangii]